MSAERDESTDFESATIDDLTAPSEVERRANAFVQEVLTIAAAYYPHLKVYADTQALLELAKQNFDTYEEAKRKVKEARQNASEAEMQEEYVLAKELNRRAETESRIARNSFQKAMEREVETLTSSIVMLEVEGPNELLVEDFFNRLWGGDTSDEEAEALVVIYDAIELGSVDYAAQDDNSVLGTNFYRFDKDLG